MCQTSFYCPECETGGRRCQLSEGADMLFFCPSCGRGYTTEDLRELYERELTALDERIAGLRSDAAWMREHLLARLPIVAAVSASRPE